MAATAPLGWRGWGEKTMPARNAVTIPSAERNALAARALPVALAALLGALVIGIVGFGQLEAVHNAAHDYRHSMGYPCH
jgi:cobalt transporter subunit CbtB